MILNVVKMDLMNVTYVCLFLRTTILAVGSFLDAFQKVADMATGTRGEDRNSEKQHNPPSTKLPFSGALAILFSNVETNFMQRITPRITQAVLPLLLSQGQFTSSTSTVFLWRE